MMTTTSQQVVVVSNQSHLNGLLETVLDAGHYDVVFVESTEHAYSHIKRFMPRLVIVCLDVDDVDGFQVLSMLKLDSDTKRIPVVTWTVSQEDDRDAGRFGRPARHRLQRIAGDAVELTQNRGKGEGAVYTYRPWRTLSTTSATTIGLRFSASCTAR